MPKGIIYVETMPVSPDREAEYHKWYNDTHLEQILSVDGIVSARRFAPTNGDGPFIAIYELDCDDLDAAARQMGGLALTGPRQPRHGPQADSARVPRDRVVRTVTLPGRSPAAHLCADGADEGGRRPPVQGHRHR